MTHPASPPADAQFVLLVEEGVLEPQAVLLVESLRRFGGRYADALVTVVSPRASRRPARHTVRELRRLGADYLALELAGLCPAYPTSWRVEALAQIERLPGPELLVQVDTDTLFLGDIGPLCEAEPACARPVDVKGMGTTGPGDHYHPYWTALCALAGITTEDLPWVRSTIDDQQIRATHNGGFVAARREAGMFARAEELFRLGVEHDLRPHRGTGLNVRAGHGEVGVEGSRWWGAAQAVVSVAAASLGFQIGPLSEAVNVPVHLWDRLDPRQRAVAHAHYHHLLNADHAGPRGPLLDGSIALAAGAEDWLRRRVPLSPRGGVLARATRALRAAKPS